MDNISAYVLAGALILIMLGMGLSLGPGDFRRVLIYPKAMIGGLLNQLVLLPIIGYGIAIAFDLPPIIAVGLMLLAACPGGATSNFITHLAKGDVALSVTLTVVASLVTIITIPLVVQFALDQFMGTTRVIALNVPSMIAQLFIIILIPISIGMFVRYRAPRFANRMDKPVKIGAAIVFVLVVVGLVIKERANMGGYFERAGVPALLLNLATMGLGFLTALVLRLPRRQAVTISIESGIQNGTLAITIATVTLQDTEFAIVAAIYSLLMFFTGAGLVAIGQALLRSRQD